MAQVLQAAAISVELEIHPLYWGTLSSILRSHPQCSTGNKNCRTIKTKQVILLSHSSINAIIPSTQEIRSSPIFTEVVLAVRIRVGVVLPLVESRRHAVVNSAILQISLQHSPLCELNKICGFYYSLHLSLRSVTSPVGPAATQ